MLSNLLCYPLQGIGGGRPINHNAILIEDPPSLAEGTTQVILRITVQAAPSSEMAEFVGAPPVLLKYPPITFRPGSSKYAPQVYAVVPS
jgi:hypothetical protein